MKAHRLYSEIFDHLYNSLTTKVKANRTPAMKPLLFTLVSLLFCLTMDAQDCSEASLDSIADPGPYTVASMIESDGLRNGPDYFGATVYYPTNAQPPYASIALVPGFFSEESTVAEWGPFFASHGIVCMTIGTNTYSQFPGARAEALVDAVQTLRAENERVASPLHMAMDTSRFAVGGWSMGGGGAQLATSLDPSLKASLALCPWLLGPTSSDLNHDVPVLIFSGQNDPTAPPSAHASVHYQLTPSSTNKLLFEVENGDHSVANGPTGANGDVGKAALSWLRTYLLDEPCFWQ